MKILILAHITNDSVLKPANYPYRPILSYHFKLLIWCPTVATLLGQTSLTKISQIEITTTKI